MLLEFPCQYTHTHTYIFMQTHIYIYTYTVSCTPITHMCEIYTTCIWYTDNINKKSSNLRMEYLRKPLEVNFIHVFIETVLHIFSLRSLCKKLIIKYRVKNDTWMLEAEA